MNLSIEDQLFIVGGATSGFGKAITQALVNEGASVIAIARGMDKLEELQLSAPNQIKILAGDLAEEDTLSRLLDLIKDQPIHGMVVNAGGPPAKMVLETTLEDWDKAYHTILRWKVALTQAIVPKMVSAGYGRIVYIESVAVKQPVENLVLSTSLRLAVVGMVKTLSQEIATTGVTLNVLGPGSHNTPAINRLYTKKAEQTGLPFDHVKELGIQQIPVGKLGEAADFAGLALWLLSPQSKFITGQTITIDGGAVKGIMG
ncbi:SDR family oxidoreductase [Sediminibacterium sp.]|uniref:SDR family oxidoreductase n=1 Tax=Sediminibacterium sp. TaxID=1917865 RepID=UPI003F71D676